MPLVRGINVTEHAYWQPDQMFANLLATASELYEVYITGGLRRDRPSVKDPATGLPTAIWPGTYCETIAACHRAGDYVLAWDGQGECELDFGGGARQRSTSGRIQLTRPDGLVSVHVRIFAVTDPNRLHSLRLTHIEDEPSWMGFAADYVRRLNLLQPSVVRFLNVSGFALPTEVFTGHRRPDTYLFQGSIGLDSRLLAIDQWEGGSRDTEVGDRIEIRRADVVVATGDVVRVNSSTSLLVRKTSGGDLPWAAGDEARNLTTGATSATVRETYILHTTYWEPDAEPDVGRVLTIGSRQVVVEHKRGRYSYDVSMVSGVPDWSDFDVVSMGFSTARTLYQPYQNTATVVTDRQVGMSWTWYGAFCAAFPFVTAIWVTIPHTAHTTYVRAMADYFRNDARLANIDVYVEISNETWNSSFEAARWYPALGVTNDMPTVLGDPYYRGAQWYALHGMLTHIEWSSSYAQQGREARVKRVLAGHNAQGEHWYIWRTIINPDDDAGYPQWPRTTVPINVWSTAPYVMHMDEAPYNTHAWVAGASDADFYNYGVAQIAQYFAASQGSPPFRYGGAVAHATWAAERAPSQGGVVCAYAAYEAGQHMLVPAGGTQQERDASNAKLKTINKTQPIYDVYELQRSVFDLIGSPVVCWFDFGSAWGVYGYFGLYENPHHVAGVTWYPKWRSVTNGGGGGQIVDALLADPPTVTAVALPVPVEVISSGPRLRGLATAVAQLTAAAMPVEVIPTTTRLVSPAGATVQLSAAPVDGRRDSIDQSRILAPAVMGLGAAALDVQRIPPATYSRDLAAANLQLGAAAINVSTGTMGAELAESMAQLFVSLSAQVVPPLGASTGSLARPYWLPLAIARQPRYKASPVNKGAGLTWTKFGREITPLQGGWQFAGFAIEPSAKDETHCRVSRLGIFRADLPIPFADGALVSMSDDMTFHLHEDEDAIPANETAIGRAYSTALGPFVFYRGAGFETAEPMVESDGLGAGDFQALLSQITGPDTDPAV